MKTPGARCFALALPLLPLPLCAQIDYRLRFDPAAEEPQWEVEMRMPGRGEPRIDAWIPRWTAGAYHLADFARGVTSVEAASLEQPGRALAVERPEPSHLVITGTDRTTTVVLRYRAKSLSSSTWSNDVIDVEANRITAGYAYVNPASLFAFVPARVDEPVTLTLELPAGWQAATVMPKDDQGRLVAPSYWRFEDSPVLCSPELKSATFDVGGVPHAVSVHGGDAEQIAVGCRRIVEAAAKLMQGLPYDRYRFLFAFVPEASGSGLEHSYSTLILLNEKVRLSPDSPQTWGLVAHEYFHLWTAERMHVQALQRPDYTQPFVTGTIWFNEGVTEYMTRHVLLHAGFLDQAAFLAGFAGAQPAARTSWTDVSRAATKWRNMYDLMQFAQRMYQQGPRTILALDLAMRRASDGERGVLDLLRLLRHAYVDAGRGFGEDELPWLIDGVAAAPLREFFGKFIDGKEQPDLAEWLAVIGYSWKDGAAVPLPDATPAQLAARADFFSASGRP